MNKEFEYYYNNVPGKGLCRNNLIYTSLINKEKTVFQQWYHNDTEYHNGQNQIVDPKLMDEKWQREMHFLHNMAHFYPSMVPEILEVSVPERKIYLKIDGVDFWQQSLDSGKSFDELLPDWREQMLDMFRAYKNLGWYKYSLHPSSYFVVDGKLKSINYFFTYNSTDAPISLRSIMSHISEDRQADLFPKMTSMGIDVDAITTHNQIQQLAFESFKTDFPSEVMDIAKRIYD